MKYINKYEIHNWEEGNTITDILLNHIEESLQDLDDAVGSTEFDGDSISDAINNSQKVTENLLNYNCYNVLQYADRKNGTSTGITWTWNEDGSVTATGEATGTAVRNLGGSSSEIPSWIVPGNTYYLKYSGTNIYFLIQYFLDGTEISGTAVRAYSDTVITVPTNITGARIRLRAVGNVVINETVNPVLLSSIPNDELGAKTEAITSTQAENTAQIARVNNILNHEPMYNYLGDVVNSPSTAYGLTCNQLDDGTYTITGTATSSRTTLFYDIYYDKTALPDGIEAGKTYHLFADSTQFGARIISYISESDSGTVLIDGMMDGFVSTDFTIPADATGISFRWQARNIVEGVSYNYTNMRIMVTPPDAFMENLIKSYNENISKNAHIWCIGNSFLNGAVYTNGHLDHMAPYDDAIYGQIAYALNISPENNTHVMYSSTGLITPPSGGANGSFLDIITQTSLAPYDFLVTHFNSGDINGHALGTIDSTANDGTIAGGVIALMDYIRTNNGLCKLILLSVPPYSSDPAKSGEYVFTGNWGMGYSINDLDTLMYQLAKKLHFIYISWQDLEISYHYMNYADYDPSQTNVRHAASNAAYRALGQYVGLQLSAAISEANVAVEAQAITDTIELITEDIPAAYITPELSVSSSGIKATYDAERNALKLSGTATGTRRILCLNGQNSIATTGTDFDQTFADGTYHFEMSILSEGQTPSKSISWSYTYEKFSNGAPIFVNGNTSATLTFTDHPAMVGLYFTNGTEFGQGGESDSDYTYITFTATRLSAIDYVARDYAKNGVVMYEPQTLTHSQQMQARDNIDSVGKDTLYQYNFYDALALGNGSTGTYNGVTYTRNNDGSWTINGTATARSFRNIITANTGGLPRYIIPGRKYRFLFHGGTVPIYVFIYINGVSNGSKLYTEDFEITFPEDMDGIIVRFDISKGTTVDNETVRYEMVPETVTSIDNYYTYNNTINKTEQVYNNTYNMSVSPTITTDTHGWLQAVDTDTADETGKTDMAPAIMAMLNSTGYCHLGEGIFYVSGSIDMPLSGMLCGCGRKTVIRLLSSITSGYTVKMRGWCTISDLRISGSIESLTTTEQGTRTGILFAANDDGQEGGSAFDSERCNLSNIWVDGFTDSDIKCHNSSQSVHRGLYAVNVACTNSWAGVNIDYRSEYCQFTNVSVRNCHYGIINNGGNNIFKGCNITANNTAFYIDGTQPNSGHGTIDSCTLNHVGSNVGSSITMHDVQNGYVVSNCQFWYGSVSLTNCTGISFSGCEFGRGTTGAGATIDVYGGNLVLFNGCVFNNDVNYPPTFTIINNTKVRLVGCYGGNSGEEITLAAYSITTKTYVLTYYTHDGTSQLYSEIVPYGGSGDYKGPTPTRGESYTWIGWGLRKEESPVDDIWDPDALNNITADRNVYAAYLSHYA